MSTGELAPFLGVLVLTALVTALLVWGLRSTPIVDDGSDAPERKTQRVPVPLVGGLALFIALVMTAVQEIDADVLWLGGAHRVSVWSAYALLGSVLVGLTDDVAKSGLRPGVKFAAQLVLALLCARHAVEARGSDALVDGGTTFALVLLAMNAFNTFDNADGCATSLAALGLGAVAPMLAAPLLGFLPFNLWLRRKAPDGSTTPLAYLGDAGSHLLGVLVALVPGAWPVLALPLLDLARLSVVRWRRGSRPWIGDRRHLAHRLQAAGLRPTTVVLALLAVAAPSVLGGAFADRAAWVLPAGLGATLLLFLGALRVTPDVP
ncbi:MAG: undecaprenyl/decaprenyl-phosphate alpha-N-acetylglucosaminyl 1-phosphate transferase [Planctomycetes bacterium]|nr:undecaprenyl/decaprenyl-phosphate alpha-N-acetylglucosaminyl 1-phosphate transferase [Planctomycetota bacterium]